FQLGVVLLQAGLVLSLLALWGEALRGAAPAVPSAARRRLGDALIYVVVLILIGSGVSKLLRVPLAVGEMTLLGLTGGSYLLVAGIEIGNGVILALRPLRALALPLVSAQAGGAICAHLIAGQYFAVLPSAVILSLCWLGIFLRHPEALWSLGAARTGAAARALAS